MSLHSALLTALLASLSLPAWGVSKTWTGGGGNGNWYNSANWSPAGVPGAADAVTIGVTASVAVSLSSPAVSFSSLTIGSPSGAAVASLFLDTGVVNSGSVLIYANSGLILGTTQTYRFNGDFTMVSGSSMTHTAVATDPQDAEIDVSVTGTFDLQAGATVTATLRGFPGGALSAAGLGPGGGARANANNKGAGGGGHGGAGGAGSGGAGGAANDTAVSPLVAGSGGGGSKTQVGAAGGGFVSISAASMTINGNIFANGNIGAAGAEGSGGGAGGAIQLSAGFFLGSGQLAARGGQGGTANGGGGGGGIVSISISTSGSVCSLSVSTNGGTGFAAGTGGLYSSTTTLLGSTVTAVSAYSGSVLWNWLTVHGATGYQVFSSTGGLGQSALLSAGTTSYLETGLLANTTYTRLVRASNCAASHDSGAALLATLALPPTPNVPLYPTVATGSIAAAWGAFPASPQDATAEAYRLEASTASDFSGTLLSSATTALAASTLTIAGLLPNTSYYFRAASLNWVGSPSYAVLGSTPSLALAPAALASPVLNVSYDSATVAWAALASSPPDASSKTAEGYLLQASSTNFGAVTPGGLILSTAAAGVAQSTLTVSGLDLGTTVYFRFGSLNWSGQANFSAAAPAPVNLQVIASSTSFSFGPIDPKVAGSTVSVSSIVVTNLGSLPVTFALVAATVTSPSSPWTLGISSGVETPVFQALWNSAQPAPGSFSSAVTASTAASGGAGGSFAGDQNGRAVGVGQSRTLWLKFWAPVSTVSTSTETIRVDVHAVYP